MLILVFDNGLINKGGKMKYQDLTEEQKGRIADAKSPEEILEMAKAEGYELTDGELEKISGGNFWIDEYWCPECGSHDVGVYKNSKTGNCHSCGYEGPLHQFLH